MVHRRHVAAAVAGLVVLGLSSSGCADAADLAIEAPETASTPSPTAAPTTPSPTTPEASETTPPPEPEEPEPAVGECRRLPRNEALLGVSLRPTPVVRCSKGHNAQTYFVGRLDRDAADAALKADRARVYAQVADRCRRHLTEWVGGDGDDLALSQFDFVVGVPGVTDVAAGARWLRCDAVVRRTEQSFQPLPRSTRGVLASARAERYGSCIKGDMEDGTTVICSLPHRWRGASAVRLGSREAKFPGGSVVNARMRDLCATRVRAYLGTTGAFEYGWVRPTKSSWKGGDRYGVCYAELSS